MRSKAQHMRFKVWVLALATMAAATSVMAQKVADKKVVKQLKKDIGYLASDELEGRRTGSEGEKLAADYIIAFYQQEGIPAYKGDYRLPFTFTTGKLQGANTRMLINASLLKKNEEAFPLAFSGNGKVKSELIPNVIEQGKIWFTPMFEDEEQAKDPHFNWEKTAFERCENAIKAGAAGVVFYDQYDAKYPAGFNKQTEYEALSVPVMYMTYKGYQAHISNSSASLIVELNTELKNKELTGNNILAYIDNKADNTVIIGAHYDHLGHGEDGNSLHANAQKEEAIHNGADDNASGTAALMQIASWVKGSNLKKYNYLFMHFSAEELGLIGSKKVVEELKLGNDKIAYMINMDMVGRLNDSTHALTVGGIGTSPAWAKAVNLKDERFKIVVDSSGVGPSDHTSFYNKDIPVLFFFTGTHKDYHKPSDDADKINYEGQAQVMRYVYSIVQKMDGMPKPAFTKTKQTDVGKVRFKVTLGIMPDYSFTEGGVRVDGVTDDRPAQKAGIKAGDIITKIGKHDIRGIQTYMEALAAFEEGEKTEVTVKRDGKEMTMPLQFTAKK